MAFRDKIVGRARIVAQRSGRYQIRMVGGDRTLVHWLLRSEILVQPREVGAEGRLVLRETGMYTSYHLIPD